MEGTAGQITWPLPAVRRGRRRTMAFSRTVTFVSTCAFRTTATRTVSLVEPHTVEAAAPAIRAGRESSPQVPHQFQAILRPAHELRHPRRNPRKGGSQMLTEPERVETRAQRSGRGHGESQSLTGVRMIEGELHRVQCQAMKPVSLAEEPVVLSLAILDVADDGTGDVFQVPPDLVHAPRQRNGFDERIAAGGREALDARDRVNLRTVLPVRDRMVDDSVFRMTAGQREIALLDSSFFECFSESTPSLGVEGHHDCPARPAVEAMHGVDPHAHSVTDRSHQIFSVV